MDEEYHSSLNRQLKRSGISIDKLPDNIESWHIFLKHVNDSYNDSDEDRYTLERSLEMSSKEMTGLYDTVEETQAMSKIGSWVIYPGINKVFWSSETYKILEYTPKVYPSLDLLLDRMASENEKNKMKEAIEKILKGESIDVESLLRIGDKELWVENRGHGIFDPVDNSLTKISGVIIDITERKELERKLKKINQELIIAARRAGMSDIAVNILHNIGNILNSVNIINDFIYSKISNSKLSNLSKALELFKKEIFNSNKQLEIPEKGKRALEYLDELSLYWAKEKETILKELEILGSHIQTINNVVKMQQSISGSVGHTEYINIEEVMDDALLVVLENISKRNIEVIKEYQPLSLIIIDKIKLIQILLNLINNAVESLTGVTKSKKSLILKIGLVDPNTCFVSVFDNGIGIKPENLPKIFTYGFTTKEKGHGFGLHSSFLLAKELKGNLTVLSDGQDCGATFTLTFPYTKVGIAKE